MTEQKCAMITGVTGQDGSYLAELLLDKGYEVVGLSRRTTNHQHENISHLGGRIAVEYGDLLDGPSIERVIADWQPDEVYNLAAMSVPADSWKQPVVTAEITAVGTMRVLEAVRRCCPTARFYQATSREIYGGVETEVIDEAAPYRANNPYGIAKLYAHLMTETYRESYGMFTCGGILFNHESPRRSLHFVTRKVTMAVAYIKTGHPSPPFDEAGRPLVLEGKLRLGNLDAVRDWGYAPEFVEAMWLILQTDEPQSTSSPPTPRTRSGSCAKSPFPASGLTGKSTSRPMNSCCVPPKSPHPGGDYSKARAELGWEPRTQFKEIIERMVDADMERLQ